MNVVHHWATNSISLLVIVWQINYVGSQWTYRHYSFNFTWKLTSKRNLNWFSFLITWCKQFHYSNFHIPVQNGEPDCKGVLLIIQSVCRTWGILKWWNQTKSPLKTSLTTEIGRQVVCFCVWDEFRTSGKNSGWSLACWLMGNLSLVLETTI